MQILNLIRIEAVPQKHRELEQTLLSMAEKIRKIKGCVNHHLYADLENSATLCVADKWASKKDFEAYLESDLFRVLIGAAGVLGKSHDRMTFSAISCKVDQNPLEIGGTGAIRDTVKSITSNNFGSPG